MVGVFVTLLLAAFMWTLAVSQQTAGVVARHAHQLLARTAVELAESALDECLADLTSILRRRLGSKNARHELLGLSRAGGPRLGPERWGSLYSGDSFAYPPHRTLELVRDLGVGVELSPVTVRFLYFDTTINHGQLELSVLARARRGGRLSLAREVSTRFNVSLFSDGVSFHIHPVPVQLRVQRQASR